MDPPRRREDDKAPVAYQQGAKTCCVPALRKYLLLTSKAHKPVAYQHGANTCCAPALLKY
jgi:hypothetical protein